MARGKSDLKRHKVAYRDQSLLAVAKYYAQLTGRTAHYYSGISDANIDKAVDVFVAHSADITPASLEALCDLEYLKFRTHVMGLIYIQNLTDAYKIADKHAGAFNHSRLDYSNERVGIYPLNDFDEMHIDNTKSLLGGQAGADKIRKAVSGTSALLSILTHSDGIDASLGKNLTVCGQQYWNKDNLPYAESKLPKCIQNGNCHRHDLEFDDFQRKLYQVDPAEFCASVLIWDVCFGIQSSDDFLDRGFELISCMLRQASLGAIITSFEFSITNMNLCESLGDALQSCSNIGQGLREHLLDKDVIDKGRRLILFGDPLLELSVANNLGDALANPSISPSKPPKASNNDKVSAYKFFKPEGENFDWLLGRGKFFDLWLSVGSVVISQTSTQCPTCNANVRIFRSNDGAPFQKRELVTCSRCGILADRPVESTLYIKQIKARQFEIIGTIPKKVTMGALQIWGGMPELSFQQIIPLNESGQFQRKLFYSLQEPFNSSRVNFFLHHGDEITVASCIYVNQ